MRGAARARLTAAATSLAPAAVGRRLRGGIFPGLQMAGGAAAAWYLAHDALGHAQPFFAPIAAAISLSNSQMQRARRSVQMVGGVLLGIGVAEAIDPLVGHGTGALAAVVIATVLIAAAVGVGFVGEGMMFVNQAAASAILVVTFHRAGTGGERALDALVGGGVALVVALLLFPAAPLRVLGSAERALLRTLAQIARDAAGLLAAPPQGTMEPGQAVELELEAGQRVHRQLTRLTAARRTARAVVRAAPRRMTARPMVDEEVARAGWVYLMAGAVLGLLRSAVSLALSGGARERSPAPGARRDEAARIGELADALELLAAAPRPWPPGAVLHARQLLAPLITPWATAAQGAVDHVELHLGRAAHDADRLLPEGNGGGPAEHAGRSPSAMI